MLPAWRHYAWRVLAAAFVILFLNSGARMVVGPMLKPMVQDMGWSRGMVSAAVMLNMAVSALAVLAMGRLYDRFGPRSITIASTGLFSAGYLLMGYMNAYWQFLVLFGILAGMGLGGLASSLFGAVLSKWFERSRGLAISLGIAGASLGQFILVPPFSAFLIAHGWRLTLVLIALVTVTVNVPSILLVIRGDPAHLGIEPFGRVPAPVRVKAGAVTPPDGFSLKEAMATRSFWLFATAMFVCGSGDFLLTTHLVAMATDHGVSAATGAGLLAWFGLMSLLGLLLAGPASDLMGNKAPMAASFVIRIAVFVLILRSQTLVSFYILALGFGLTFMVTAPLTPTLAGRMYGFAAVGVIGGLITTFHHMGGGLFAYLGGLIFDRTGDYSLAFIMSLGLSGLALVCTLLIREERHAVPGVAAAAVPSSLPSAATLAREVEDA